MLCGPPVFSAPDLTWPWVRKYEAPGLDIVVHCGEAEAQATLGFSFRDLARGYFVLPVVLHDWAVEEEYAHRFFANVLEEAARVLERERSCNAPGDDA